jgi:hypothetical protein
MSFLSSVTASTVIGGYRDDCSLFGLADFRRLWRCHNRFEFCAGAGPCRRGIGSYQKYEIRFDLCCNNGLSMKLFMHELYAVMTFFEL